MTSTRSLFVLAAAIVVAAPAMAQQARTIPGLENYSIPAAQPTPVPVPTPTPSATPIPIPAAPRLVLPTPTHTSPPSATPPQSRSRAKAGVVAPVPSPTPTPLPSNAPSPVAVEPPAPVAPPPVVTRAASTEPAASDEGHERWLWLLAPAMLAVIVLAILFARRRRPVEDGPELIAAADVPMEAFDVPPSPVPPLPVEPRARIALVFRPVRAGVNLLSATVESEITLRNDGDAPADEIRLAVRLTSAHAGQDADLAEILSQPIIRPAVPVFALAPGEERRVRVVAALPRDAIRAMNAAGRPMFVPLLAVNILYPAGQTTQVFAIGVERTNSEKLSPFWLDGPPRTFDTVVARAHAAAVER